MVFTVFLLSCCTLCYFLCQKVNSLMFCFTSPMPQVNTLTWLSFDTLTGLCLSRQANAVCFAWATWLLLSSSCKRSLCCCCTQLVLTKTFFFFLLVSSFFLSEQTYQSKQITCCCYCLLLLSSLVAIGTVVVNFLF